MCLKHAGRMANSAGPDETSGIVWSGSVLFTTFSAWLISLGKYGDMVILIALLQLQNVER